MNEKKQNPISKLLTMKLGKIPILAIIAVVVTVAVIILSLTYSAQSKKKKEFSAIATLEKMIDVSELSTFQSVYNGVAVSYNTDNPEKIDYHVSYEATVKAGIDFDKIAITLEDDSIIKVALPKVEITGTNVVFESMQFIFVNKKAETQTVTVDAYELCKQDVDFECKNNEAILALAEENAINIITALTTPLIEQLGEEYSLIIE